jgi:2-oxo-4-hydroxy-4-carboxy-5-ureidoimidazoline decarboxylase
MISKTAAIHRLNAASDAQAWNALSRCCGASRWILKMMRARPFCAAATLLEQSDAAFETLERADWLEAFSHHPKIGDLESLRSKFAATRDWAGNEQAGTNAADEATLRALAGGNSDYEQKFGFIFIICATGKSAEEMLLALRARLPNAPEEELHNAAQQQTQITRLRLRKLLAA